MANGGQIRFGVGFDVDQSSLSKLKSSLKEIQNLSTKDLKLIDSNATEVELNKIKQSASELQGALQRSFNTDLGTLNISKFNQELHKLDLNTIQRNLAQAGTVGQKAFKDIATQALTTNMQLKQTNNFLDQMSTTMLNTVKWGVASSVMNNFTGSVQEAFGYIKALDSSLNDIRIVTGQSSEEMSKFAVQANEAAAALGRQTKEYTQAALTFYQQGLDDSEVQARTETVLKASNITGENTAQMADYLTAVWNGFKVSLGEEEQVVDKLAAVADTSASNMAELATGMSKVASVANNMGVDIDQLSAQLATIIATTRQAPESVGNALKTIYTRVNDIKTGSDEAEISLGNYSAKLASVGFNVLDASGRLRDMGEVMEEIGDRWGDLSKEQQIFVARTMAGQRQINNLLALFDNWDKYNQELAISMEAEGTLEQKNAIYMESLAAHIKELSAAKEKLISSFADGDSFKGLIDGLTTVTNLFADFIKNIGGGGTALLGLGTIATNVLSKQLAGGLSTFIVNLQNAKENIENVKAQFETINLIKGLNINDNQLDELTNIKQRALELGTALSKEEQNEINNIIRMTAEIQDQENAWKADTEATEQYLQKLDQVYSKGEKDLENPELFRKGLLNLNRQELEELSNITKDESLIVKELKQDINDFSNSIKENTTILEKEISENSKDIDIKEQEKIAIESLKETVQNFKTEVLDNIDVEKLNTKEIQNLEKAYEDFENAVNNSDNTYSKIEQQAKKVAEVAKKSANELEKEAELANKTVNSLQENNISRLAGQREQAGARKEEIFKKGDITKNAQGAMQFIGSLSSIAFGISSITNAYKVLNDETSTATEKFNALATSGLMGLTSLGQGVFAVVTKFGSLTAVLESVLPLLGAIAPYALVIAGIGTAVYIAYQEFTKFERAVDDANKQLQRQQELLEKVKQEQSELTNYIDKYEELSDKIKNITRYTDEWRGVNDELNQSVSELIAKFPELTKYVTTIEGHIGLTEKGIEAAKQASELAIQSATLGQLTSQKQLLQAQQKLSLNNTVNKIGSLDYNTNGTSALYNDIGAVNARVHLNALDGEGNHVSISIDEAKELQAALEALKDSNEEIWYNDVLLKETLIKNENISSQIADKLVEHKDALQQLQITTNNNLEALNNLNNTITETYLQRSDKFQGDENAIYRELIAQSTGQDQTNYVKDYWNLQAESNADTIGNFEDVIEDFLQTETGKQYAGIEYQFDKEHSQGWAFTTEEADKNTKYLFGDVSISIKEMKDAIQTAGQYNTAIEKAEKHHFDEAVKAFEKMDQNIAASMLHSLQEGSTLDYTQYTKEQQEAFEEGLYSGAFSDEKLQEYGINIAEGFEEGRKNQKIEDAKQKDIDTRATIFNQSKSLDELHLLSNIGQDKNTSTDQLQQIQNNLHKISLESEVADKSVLKIFDSFNLKGQKAVDISGVLVNDINNLGTEGSFEKLSNDLKENGLAVNFMDQSWQQLIHESGAYTQFLEHLSDKVSSLNNIITETASGKKMSKSEFKQFNEDLQDTLNLLGDISQLSPQLQQDIVTIQDSFLQGTQQWNDALKRVREEAEMATASLDFSNMEEAFDNLSKKIDESNNSSTSIKMKLDIDADDFNEKMQQFLDADYTLELSVNADITSDLKDMGDMRDQISQLDALVGKTSVAFDDIRGIYSDLIMESENAVTVLEDGSVQISDTAIAEAKRRKEEELAAARETTQGEIQEQMNRIKAKIAVYETELKAENEYIQALNQQKSAIESGNNTARNETAKVAAAKKKAYEEEVNNANKKVKAIDEAAGKEVEAVNNSSESQVVAMQGVVDADQKMIDSAATTAEKVSKSVADMAKSTIANYDAMAAAKANAMAEHPQVSSGAQAVGAVAGSRGTVESIGALKTLDYQSVGESKIELDFSDSAAQELQNVENELAKTTESRNQTQNQLDRYKGQLEALTGQLVDLNSGNYANNAGEHPKADKGGKGGGGGKGKSAKEKTEKEPDKMEPFEDNDLDSIEGKFHDIDAVIKQLQRDIDKLGKLQDRYLGSALVHNLNQQLSLYKKQKVAYEEKLKIAKQELEQQKAKLEAQGVEIGKNGTIKNYTELLKQKQKEVNGLVDKYNASTKEGQENLKGQVEAQKKNYNELKQQMNAYEQLNGQTLPEIEAQIAQIEEMIINLQIEKFNAVIELHIDWQNFLKDYKNFQKELTDFFNTRATVFINEQGQRSGANDIWANAQAMAKAKADAARAAEIQRENLDKAYQDNLKKSKGRKSRKELAEELGLSTDIKRKDLQKYLADEYEKAYEAIRQEKKKLQEDAEKLYKDSLVPSSDEVVEIQTELRNAFDEINKTADEERAKKQQEYAENQQKFKDRKKNENYINDLEEYYGEDLSEYSNKEFKNLMLENYRDALDEIEKVRQDSLDQAVKDYDQAMAQVTNESEVRIVDVIKGFTNQINALIEASDQMLNGTILNNGNRATSIIDDQIKHAGDLSERIQRMNQSTTRDKQGNKVMGTDDLKVGDVNPLTGEKITNKKELKQVKKQIGKDKSGQVYADMQKKIYEDGKKYAEELENTITTLQEQIEQAWEVYYAVIDKVHEYDQKIIDDYEYLNDLYDIQAKAAKLLGKSEADALKNKRENTEKELEYYRKRINLTYKELEAVKKSQGIESEAYKKYYEEYQKLVKNSLELRLEYIELLREEESQVLDDLIDKYNLLHTSNLRIDVVSDRWNDEKTQAESYLNTLNKVYETQKLRSEYQELIDSTDNLAYQEKLRDIMEQQVSALEQAEYLSEAEVTNAQDMLEVVKAQMALEEAKQNKSKMRLRRDSQGNYTYQFVADQNKVEDKAKAVQDALKKMNDDTTKALEENYDNQVNLFKEFISRLQEINNEYTEGNITKAEFDEKANYIGQWFAQQGNIYDTQQGRLKTNYSSANTLLTIGEAQNAQDLDKFVQLLGLDEKNSAAITKILKDFTGETGSKSILDLIGGGTNIKEVLDGMYEGTSGIIDDIDGVYDLFSAYPDQQMTDWQTTRDDANQLVSDLKAQVLEGDEKIINAENELKSDMNADIKSVESVIGDDIKAVQALQNDLDQRLPEILQAAQEIEAKNTAAMADAQLALNQIVNALQEMAEEEKNASMKKGDTVNLAKGSNLTNIYNKKGKDIGYINSDVDYKILGFKTVQGMDLVHIKNQSTGYSYWVERKDLELKEMATGGYTGDWSGNEGKVAVLHKKELVLNQDDTSKILNAVELANSITDAIKSLGLSATSQTSSITGALFTNKDGAAVDQNVVIHADFPNVTNHTEIEEALMNLVNVASQKASPNRRTY